MQYRLLALIGFFCVAFSVSAQAAAYTIYVAPGKDSPAAAVAASKDNGTTERAATSIQKAFDLAFETLKQCGVCKVVIKVAEGDYSGRAGTASQWVMADLDAKKSVLHVLGGYNADYTARDPFKYLSKAVNAKGRTNAMMAFEFKRGGLKELVVSGFFFDVGDSNIYRANGTQLLKGTSSGLPILRFGYIETQRLVIADNTFINAVHSVAAPSIRAATPDAEVIVRNNVLINNVYTWDVVSAGFRNIPARYVIEGNSFILNWPYNPDAGTSNPGTLEIGNKYAAKNIIIRGNLFAHNVSGAIFPQYDDKNGPPLEVTNNLFYKNGTLFGVDQPDDGAFVGSFAGSVTKKAFSADAIAEDFNWKIANNSTFDPQLAVPSLKVKLVRYKADDRAEISVGNDDSSSTPAAGGSAPPSDVDIAIDTSQLSDASGPVAAPGSEAAATSTTTSAETPTEPVVDIDEENDRLFHAPDADTRSFAPKFDRARAPLFPLDERAQSYGASSSRITEFN